MAALPKPLPDFPLGGPYVLARVDNPEYHIRLFYGLLRDTDHEAPELIFGAGKPRRVLKHNLTALVRVYRTNLASRGLGLLRSNRDFRPDQVVHQRRFSHIGAPDQRDKT